MAAVHLFLFESFGVGIWRGTPPMMRRLHSHTEVEFNLVTRGSLTYRFAGEPVTLKAGALHVFGGITPHELEDFTPGARFMCLTVPLAAFIRWRLPENVSGPLLRGEILSDADQANDVRRFSRWWEDLEGGDPRRARVMLPEVQARIERMALSPALATAWRRRTAGRDGNAEAGTLRRVEQMLQTIAARFAEPLSLAELAEGTGWHPHYAAGQFRKWIGLPPGEFLLQQRVAHAKHLLATGESKVIDVAEECGFATQSSFYAAFTRLTGKTPARFRREQ
jgi:AraC family transcriptional regulator, melibiose operon regulatory protein